MMTMCFTIHVVKELKIPVIVMLKLQKFPNWKLLLFINMKLVAFTTYIQGGWGEFLLPAKTAHVQKRFNNCVILSNFKFQAFSQLILVKMVMKITATLCSCPSCIKERPEACERMVNWTNKFTSHKIQPINKGQRAVKKAKMSGIRKSATAQLCIRKTLQSLIES